MHVPETLPSIWIRQEILSTLPSSSEQSLPTKGEASIRSRLSASGEEGQNSSMQFAILPTARTTSTSTGAGDMNEFSSEARERFTRWHLLASTPTFLFRKLIADDLVRECASMSEEELRQLARNEAAAIKGGLSSEASIYAIAIAGWLGRGVPDSWLLEALPWRDRLAQFLSALAGKTTIAKSTSVWDDKLGVRGPSSRTKLRSHTRMQISRGALARC